jgi:hypothetical protein
MQIRMIRRLLSRSDHKDGARGILKATTVFVGHRHHLTPDRNPYNLRMNSDFLWVYLGPVRHRFAELFVQRRIHLRLELYSRLLASIRGEKAAATGAHCSRTLVGGDPGGHDSGDRYAPSQLGLFGF